jgi:cytochrome c556
MVPRRRGRAAGVGLSVGIVLAGIVVAGTGIASLLDDRESTMRQMARAAKSLEQMAKRHAFDAAETAQRSAEIASLLLRFKDLFPDGSEHADQAASPAIWTDRAGFEKARAKATDAALALAKVTDAGGLADAVQHQAQTCRACHKKFRIDP